MTGDKDQKIITAKGGMFHDLTARVKLIIRLMADRRVNPLLKLLPIGTLVYLAVPDLVLGPIDDVAVIWLGTYLFVELCPPDVVQEHMATLTSAIPGEWRESQPPVEASTREEGEIIDAEYWEKRDGE